MSMNKTLVNAGVALVLGCVLLWAPLVVFAQPQVIPPPTQPQSGVAVDAEGVLRMAPQARSPQYLAARRAATEAMRRSLPEQMSKPTSLRFVSLNRLESQITANGGVPTDEMRHLAGLVKIRYVFFIPETKDIVLAGPAEGWVPDVYGEMVGATSQQAVCQLEDLAVALRAFPAGGRPTPLVGCSIDPTQEGLAAMQNFVNNFRGGVSRPAQEAFVRGIRNSLGYQNISVNGISPRTHAAHVLVSADLRMKLIGFNVEPAPVSMVTFLDVLNRRPYIRRTGNALTRWFFVPDYENITLAEDGLGIELSSAGVKLVDEVETITASGERKIVDRKPDSASQTFTNNFTEHYAKIATQESVYAQLRNVIDMTVAAAYIQQQDFYAKANWKPAILCNESLYPVERLSPPQRVEPVVVVVARGNSFTAPTGGIDIDPLRAINPNPKETRRSDDGQIAETRSKIVVPNNGAWWWQ